MDKCGNCNHDFEEKKNILRCPYCKNSEFDLKLIDLSIIRQSNRFVFKCTKCNISEFIDIFQSDYSKIKQMLI